MKSNSTKPRQRIRERDIDQALVRYAKSRGCLIYKFSSPSHRGVADRILVTPKLGTVVFIELKAPGEKPTALQLKFINEITNHGGLAYWVASVEAAKELVDGILQRDMLS